MQNSGKVDESNVFAFEEALILLGSVFAGNLHYRQDPSTAMKSSTLDDNITTELYKRLAPGRATS